MSKKLINKTTDPGYKPTRKRPTRRKDFSGKESITLSESKEHNHNPKTRNSYTVSDEIFLKFVYVPSPNLTPLRSSLTNEEQLKT